MAKGTGKAPTPKQPIQNNVGNPIPGGAVSDFRKSGMTIQVTKLPNLKAGKGGIGSGSGKLGGGSLGGSASSRKKH